MPESPITPAKAVLITGGSRGIGRAVARRLAKDGFAVAVNYAGRKTDADAAVAEITAAGGRAVAIQADVSKTDDVRRLFDEAGAALGPLGLLVNSAGVMSMLKITDAPSAEGDAIFDRTMAINVRGTFNTMRQAAQVMPEGSRIINFSTSVLGLTLPGYGPYAASKAAVEVLTRILAHELRGRRITVNAVAPGPTATELFFEGKTQETVDRLAKLAPLERIGDPDEIAAVVAFLAGPDGAWINAQTLRANGGYV